MRGRLPDSSAPSWGVTCRSVSLAESETCPGHGTNGFEHESWADANDGSGWGDRRAIELAGPKESNTCGPSGLRSRVSEELGAPRRTCFCRGASVILRSMGRMDGAFRAGVGIRTYPLADPLANVRGKDKAIRITTDAMGETIAIASGKEPFATAAAGLKDLEHILAARGAAPYRFHSRPHDPERLASLSPYRLRGSRQFRDSLDLEGESFLASPGAALPPSRRQEGLRTHVAGENPGFVNGLDDRLDGSVRSTMASSLAGRSAVWINPHTNAYLKADVRGHVPARSAPPPQPVRRGQ